jgi:hypothetical protein
MARSLQSAAETGTETGTDTSSEREMGGLEAGCLRGEAVSEDAMMMTMIVIIVRVGPSCLGTLLLLLLPLLRSCPSSAA